MKLPPARLMKRAAEDRLEDPIVETRVLPNGLIATPGEIQTAMHRVQVDRIWRLASKYGVRVDHEKQDWREWAIFALRLASELDHPALRRVKSVTDLPVAGRRSSKIDRHKLLRVVDAVAERDGLQLNEIYKRLHAGKIRGPVLKDEDFDPKEFKGRLSSWQSLGARCREARDERRAEANGLVKAFRSDNF